MTRPDSVLMSEFLLHPATHLGAILEQQLPYELNGRERDDAATGTQTAPHAADGHTGTFGETSTPAGPRVPMPDL